MGETAENVAARLWRDRAQIREEERDEAQARARLAEEKLTALTAENDQLARRNIQLRDQNDRLAVEIAGSVFRTSDLRARLLGCAPVLLCRRRKPGTKPSS